MYRAVHFIQHTLTHVLYRLHAYSTTTLTKVEPLTTSYDGTGTRATLTGELTLSLHSAAAHHSQVLPEVPVTEKNRAVEGRRKREEREGEQRERESRGKKKSNSLVTYLDRKVKQLVNQCLFIYWRGGGGSLVFQVLQSDQSDSFLTLPHHDSTGSKEMNSFPSLVSLTHPKPLKKDLKHCGSVNFF